MKLTRPEEAHGALAMGLMYTEHGAWKLWRHGGFWGSMTLHEESSATTVAFFINHCLDLIPTDVRRGLYAQLVIAAAG